VTLSDDPMDGIWRPTTHNVPLTSHEIGVTITLTLAPDTSPSRGKARYSVMFAVSSATRSGTPTDWDLLR
jgi:hypothetical protein